MGSSCAAGTGEARPENFWRLRPLQLFRNRHWQSPGRYHKKLPNSPGVLHSRRKRVGLRLTEPGTVSNIGPRRRSSSWSRGRSIRHVILPTHPHRACGESTWSTYRQRRRNDATSTVLSLARADATKKGKPTAPHLSDANS